MARKLTIRRVGGLLPALSLVVLVLLASLITWLSTAGLPQSALRRIEQAAAKEGIYLSIGQLKLSPSSGLAVRARHVKLYARQGDTEPLAQFYRATLGISASQLLFHGKLQPTMAEFRDLSLNIPTDEATPLVLRRATASALVRRGQFVRLTSANAQLEGIPITVHGAFLLPEGGFSLSGGAEDKEQAAPVDIPALLEPCRPMAGRIRRAIARQQWAAEELPSVALRLQALRKTQLGARISIPRFDEEQFHFRDVLIDIAYQNNTVLINDVSFRTVEPDSEVKLQGGYDVTQRHLSVNLQSTAALTRMAEALTAHGVDTEFLSSWLSRFHHADDSPPGITLRGNLYFEEDYSVKSLSLLGNLSQRKFIFGKTPIDELSLSFFYRDGSFNIDRLQLTFPTGSLTASAFASSDTLKGKAAIMADLDIPQLLRFASEFTTEPLTLPEGLVLNGNLQFDISAELDMPEFISGARQLEQFLPTVHKLNLSVGIAEAAHYGYSLLRPRVSVELNEIQRAEGELIPNALEQALITFSAEAINLPAEEGKESGLTLRNASGELELRGLSLEEVDEGSPISPRITSAGGSLRLGALSLPGFRAEALEATLSEAEDIRPLAADWRHMLKQATLRVTSGAMHADNTLLGALDTRLALDDKGLIDLTTVLNREGHHMKLELHPQLTEEGLLVMEQVQLKLPAAGFAPLLVLTGADITQIHMPEEVLLSGSATYDTRRNLLLQGEGELSIPHLVRTPGDGVAAFRGLEIPVSLHMKGSARGQENGHVNFNGELTLIHKEDGQEDSGRRKLQLSFEGDSASHVNLKGNNTMDVNTLDQLIDVYDAHVIMRDFDASAANARTDINIRSVHVNWADGLLVEASCAADIANIGYQMNAYVVEEDASGKPTGKETLRKDFGKDPFRRVEKANANVDVLVKLDKEGKMQATRISILNADLTYDNRPWLRSQGFKGGAPTSRLQGDAVIIDVHKSFVELRNVKGRCYPAYAIGAYYDEIPGFLETLVLRQPARLETEHCLFPIYGDCPYPMSGCIRVMAKEAGFNFLGTTFPLESLSGFIWFENGAVHLDRLNAACWDGGIDAAVTINYAGRSTGFDGYAKLRNINLKPLAAAYGSRQQPALCSGDIRFRTPTPEIRDLQAYGELHIVNGDLMNLSLFRPVGDLISDLPGNLAELERKALRTGEVKEPSWLDRQITKLFQTTGKALGNVGDTVGHVTNNIPFANHFLRYDLQEAHGRFSIGKGKLVTDGLKALGYNLNVSVQLAIDLEKLTLEGDIWPKISSVPTVILSPITFLSKFIIDIHVFGALDDIQWEFDLNRKRKEETDECSVTDEEPRQKMKPRKS